MKNQGHTFTDRLETAAKAKQALLEKAARRTRPTIPSSLPGRAARIAAAREREERETERRNAKLAEQARVKAEREAEAARKAAEAAAEAERIRQGKRPVVEAGTQRRPSRRRCAMPATPPARRARSS